MKLTILIIIGILLLSTLSIAAIYPSGHLNVFSQFTVKFIETDAYYTPSGKLQKLPLTQDITYSIYGELALFNRIALLWNTAIYKTLITQGDITIDRNNSIATEREAFIVSGTGDLELGTKIGFLNWNHIQIAGSFWFGIPGFNQKSQFIDQTSKFDTAVYSGYTFIQDTLSQQFGAAIPINKNDYTTTFALDVGYFLPINSFVASLIEFSLGYKYQIRNRGNKDVRSYNIKLGGFFFNLVYLSLNHLNSKSIGNINDFNQYDTKFTSSSISAYINIIENLGVTFGVEGSGKGNHNTYSATAYQSGFFVKF